MKTGNYERISDNKQHKFLGYTDAKNSAKKGKLHLAKIVVQGNFVNLFKSAGGCYICDLDGNMLYDKVAILSVTKEGKEIYFALSQNAFLSSYKRKVTA